MNALIVDDDRTLADLLAFTLRRDGFEPYLAFDAPSALEMFTQMPVAVVILDVNLPGRPGLENGFDVCRAIRKISEVPIILLTVRDEESDIIKGLDLGADDYILKPFSPSQLLARVRTVIRRSSVKTSFVEAPYIYNEIKFDPNFRSVIRQGEDSIKLTRLEARLLEYLMLNAGQILPAENIIAFVWDPGGGSTEMLRQLIRRLRRKIELDPSKPALIVTLAGVGYGLGIS